jgi:hypothetical protein
MSLQGIRYAAGHVIVLLEDACESYSGGVVWCVRFPGDYSAGGDLEGRTARLPCHGR